MTSALMVSLFMPDIWVLVALNSNVVIDAILCSVMALFLMELVTLSAVDASYMSAINLFVETPV